MALPPTFRYFLGGAEMPVSPGSPLWESPLPVNRHHFQGGDTDGAGHNGLSHGDYFKAARHFLENIGPTAFSPQQKDRISDIQICLMKHGEFYHPSRIRVGARNWSRSFVLNVAVSESGRRVIDAEVSALKRLGHISAPSFIPAIYGKGSIAIGGTLTADMFLGEWFEGYHEFHLSRSPVNDAQTLCVWGESDIPYYLTSEEASLLYHQAAKILTLYYNSATTEHISHWHHAGGDFVVKRESNRLKARLITVRRYGAMLQTDKTVCDPSQKRDQALAALLLFFLTLSIRMRLDRLDGIGDVAWADDVAVIGVWTGFIEGLSDNYFPSIPDPISQFKTYLSGYSIAGLCDLARTLAAALPISTAEKAVVETNIERHMEVLCGTIGSIGFP